MTSSDHQFRNATAAPSAHVESSRASARRSGEESQPNSVTRTVKPSIGQGKSLEPQLASYDDGMGRTPAHGSGQLQRPQLPEPTGHLEPILRADPRESTGSRATCRLGWTFGARQPDIGLLAGTD